MVIMPVYASVGKEGGVASQIHLSTMEGVKILENGGNAFDAAITISSLLTVLLPNLGSIGGDGFLLALNSGDELIAYNGSGRSSQDFPVEKYLRQKPIKGSLTITVPGLVDLWEWTNMNFGSRDLGSLLNKAISLARNGFCAQESLSQAIETVRSILANSETWKEMRDRDGFLGAYKSIPIIYLQQYLDGYGQVRIDNENFFIVSEGTGKLGMKFDIEKYTMEAMDVDTYDWNMHAAEMWGAAFVHSEWNYRVYIT